MTTNKKNKSKGNKQLGGKIGMEGFEVKDIFKEDSGIPIGLLLLLTDLKIVTKMYLILLVLILILFNKF